jgi:hypothetical protein
MGIAIPRIIVPRQQPNLKTPRRGGGELAPGPLPCQVPDPTNPSTFPSPEAHTYPPALPDEDYLDYLENTKRSKHEIRRTDFILIGLTALIVLLMLLATFTLLHHSHINS